MPRPRQRRRNEVTPREGERPRVDPFEQRRQSLAGQVSQGRVSFGRDFRQQLSRGRLSCGRVLSDESRGTSIAGGVSRDESHPDESCPDKSLADETRVDDSRAANSCVADPHLLPSLAHRVLPAESCPPSLARRVLPAKSRPGVDPAVALIATTVVNPTMASIETMVGPAACCLDRDHGRSG